VQCSISANTVMGCPTARAQHGPTNTAVTTHRQSIVAIQPPKDASGIEKTEHAPVGKPTRRRMEKRPDYRQQYKERPLYYCLRRFMGGYAQSGCQYFVIDPDHDKCLYQDFSGCCWRSDE
jgi:hypothetical protein